jgi:hypothetical protein
VDVITGVIKANFPTRISFQVSSKVDSRTIIDQHGAEKLLGSGDMLFIPPGVSKLVRIHGAYVSDKEIDRIVAFICNQATPAYDQSIAEYQHESPDGEKAESDFDEKYDEAVELVADLGQASISLVQRYMKIGYNRAARMIESMEKECLIGPSEALYPSTLAVYIGMVSNSLPFAVLPLYTNVEKLDWALVEASRDLYAGSVRVFFHAIFPQTLPGLVTAVILTFIPAMGAFVIPDLLGGGKTWMLGNLIQHQFGVSRDFPFGAAVSLVLTFLTMVGLLVLRRSGDEVTFL